MWVSEERLIANPFYVATMVIVQEGVKNERIQRHEGVVADKERRACREILKANKSWLEPRSRQCRCCRDLRLDRHAELRDVFNVGIWVVYWTGCWANHSASSYAVIVLESLAKLRLY